MRMVYWPRFILICNRWERPQGLACQCVSVSVGQFLPTKELQLAERNWWCDGGHPMVCLSTPGDEVTPRFISSFSGVDKSSPTPTPTPPLHTHTEWPKLTSTRLMYLVLQQHVVAFTFKKLKKNLKIWRANSSDDNFVCSASHIINIKNAPWQ